MSASSQAVPPGLKPLVVSSVYSLGEYEQCLLVIWKLQPTLEAFERRDAALADLAARFSAGCAYLELIETESKPPPGDVRKVALQVFPKLGKSLTCVGACIDGTQVRSAFVRAILAGMMFLIPQFPPAKVFKRVGDMTEWTRQRLGMAEESERKLVAAFEYLRKAPASA